MRTQRENQKVNERIYKQANIAIPFDISLHSTRALVWCYHEVFACESTDVSLENDSSDGQGHFLSPSLMLVLVCMLSMWHHVCLCACTASNGQGCCLSPESLVLLLSVCMLSMWSGVAWKHPGSWPCKPKCSSLEALVMSAAREPALISKLWLCLWMLLKSEPSTLPNKKNLYCSFPNKVKLFSFFLIQFVYKRLSHIVSQLLIMQRLNY